jgi:hypothetical protein
LLVEGRRGFGSHAAVLRISLLASAALFARFDLLS